MKKGGLAKDGEKKRRVLFSDKDLPKLYRMSLLVHACMHVRIVYGLHYVIYT